MINKPKVSIIIPVYNAEKYIEKCLNSCINQTIKDIEIILVNDGSVDNTSEILKRYNEKDERIIVINQENAGQGIARNRGLDIAKGEYIYFVDSDDFLEKNLCEETYNCAIKNDADAVLFNYKHYDKNGSTPLEVYNIKDWYGKNGSKIVSNSFNSLESIKSAIFKIDSAVWKYVYKKEFLNANNIKFPNIRPTGEDLPFSLEVKISAKIFYLDKTFYNHRIDISDSVSTNPIPWIDILKKELKILKKHNKLDYLKQEYINMVTAVYYSLWEDKREKLLNSLKDTLDDDLLLEIRNHILLEQMKLNIKQELYSELKRDLYNELKITPAKVIKNVFSCKNEYSNNKKYKVITVLGIKTKFKTTKTRAVVERKRERESNPPTCS